MIDERLLAVCADQFGVISSRQLRDLGLDPTRIHRLRKHGILVRMTANVDRVRSSRETFAARCMAAQLHMDGTGFLSGSTAARIYGLRRMRSDIVHLTVPERRRASLPSWVSLHRSSWYHARRDRRQLDNGLVVAEPGRMLFGLAATLNQHRFERAAEDAWHLGLTTPTDMAAYLEEHRCRGKNGVRRIERWLERTSGSQRPAQSGLERELLDALSTVGLPEPVRQHPVRLGDDEVVHVDIAWPDIGLAVEPGASWWHGGDAGQRRDQRRDAACAEVGWQVVRFDETMREDPLAAARQVRAIHRRRCADLASLEAVDPSRRP